MGSRLLPSSPSAAPTRPAPPGVLLSGGLDSSLVASIAARKIARDGDNKWGK